MKALLHIPAAHSSGGLSGSGSVSSNSIGTIPVLRFSWVIRLAAGTLTGSSKARMTVWTPSLPRHGFVSDLLLLSALGDIAAAMLMSRKGGPEWFVLGCLLFMLGVQRVVALLSGLVAESFLLVSYSSEIVTVCACVLLDMVSLSMGQRVVAVNLFFMGLVLADITSRTDLRWK